LHEDLFQQERDLIFVHFQDIGEIYQQEQDLEKASDYLERAADLFDSEGQTSQSNTIKQKVAEIAAQLEQ
jgi:alpha-soluble NSF attachment protein